MENQSVYDVRPEQYATVIRELIRHENDVTNHRTMWLLIIQGLLVNAYVGVRLEPAAARGIALAGILVTLSAFVMLYKSYQARGYLNFLGAEAKRGKLQEEYLRLDGWPRKRVKDWRRGVWICPWLERAGDVIEPYLCLPVLTVFMWTFLLLHHRIPLRTEMVIGVSFVLSLFVFCAFCILRVWSQKTAETEESEGAKT